MRNIVKGLKFYIFKFLNSFIKKALGFNIININDISAIGENAFISSSTLRGNIIIHDNSTISSSSVIGKVKIGSNSLIINSYLNGNINIQDSCKLNGVFLDGRIHIGKNSSIWGPNSDIYSRINPVFIGNFCSIARNVSIQEYNHQFDRLTSYYIFSNVFKDEQIKDVTSKGPIEIGHDVWIGAQCVILSGAKIGNGAVIAANSVVSSEIPSYAIAGGTPAKVIKFRFESELIDILEELQWWLWPNEKIIKNRELFEGKLTKEKLKSILQ